MKSYLKFLSRNKLYTAIEAVGLIVSLAFVLLTGHYVWKQRQMTRNVPDYKDVYSFYRATDLHTKPRKAFLRLRRQRCSGVQSHRMRRRLT